MFVSIVCVCTGICECKCVCVCVKRPSTKAEAAFNQPPNMQAYIKRGLGRGGGE